MGRRCCLGIFALGTAIALSTPGVALGVQGEILLCYGAGYDIGGTQRTHHGVDIAAPVGEPVLSFAEGEVSFAGRIPSDDGGSVFAVTVRTADGLLVTVHPLSESWVSQGERVSVGDALGATSPSGDASVGEPHVHLSVRKGEAYLDPSFLLSQPILGPEEPVGSQSGPQWDSSPVPESSSGETALSAGTSIQTPVVKVAQTPVAPAVAPVAETPSVQLSADPHYPTQTDPVAETSMEDMERHRTPQTRASSSPVMRWLSALPEGDAATRGLAAAAGVIGFAATATLVGRRTVAVSEVD
ncbi:MAG: M23 family metallopeptidase [Coriobacteriia bacterium]|nr:M23 family metallopeptidase [Coriobacteriia bacterium]